MTLLCLCWRGEEEEEEEEKWRGKRGQGRGEERMGGEERKKRVKKSEAPSLTHTCITWMCRNLNQECIKNGRPD